MEYLYRRFFAECVKVALATVLVLVALPGCTTSTVVGCERGELVRTEVQNEVTGEEFQLSVAAEPTAEHPILVVLATKIVTKSWEEQKVFAEIERSLVTHSKFAPDFFLWPLYPVKVAGGLTLVTLEAVWPIPVYLVQFTVGLSETIVVAVYNPVIRWPVYIVTIIGTSPIGLILTALTGEEEAFWMPAILVSSPDMLLAMWTYFATGGRKSDLPGLDHDEWHDIPERNWATAVVAAWKTTWRVGWVGEVYEATIPHTWDWTWEPFAASPIVSGPKTTETRPTGKTIEDDWKTVSKTGDPVPVPKANVTVSTTDGQTVTRATGFSGTASFGLLELASGLKYDGVLDLKIDADQPVESNVVTRQYPVSSLRAALPPTVTLKSGPGEVARPLYVVEGSAEGDRPLASISVELNGFKQAERGFPKAEYTAEISEKILLREGANTITITIRDIGGLEASQVLNVIFNPRR